MIQLHITVSGCTRVVWNGLVTAYTCLYPVASASVLASTTPVGPCATASAILTVADSYFENVLDCILLINIGNRQFNFTLSPALQLFPLYLVMKLSRLFLSKET